MMELQKKFCEEKGFPFFAPTDGICRNCHGIIIDTNTEHITGCPHCNYSFCE
jgi:hypothetical protein